MCVDVCHGKHLISPLWKDAKAQGFLLLPVSAGLVWCGLAPLCPTNLCFALDQRLFMGLADLTETVEVLCHQMFYRVVGMQKTEVAAATAAVVCVCVCGCVSVSSGGKGGVRAGRSGATDVLLWASLIIEVKFGDLC